MRKASIIGMVMMLVMLLISACGGGSSKNDSAGSGGSSGNSSANSSGATTETSSGDSGGSSNETKEITVFHFKVEIADLFEEMAQAYEQENPGTKVKVETIGGGADWLSYLKAQFASGQGPDIFVVEGPGQAKLWREYMLPLNDEPWVEHSLEFAKQAMTFDGELLAMPYTIEGLGLVYNKKIFEEVGITQLPRTISELREVSQKLKDAGYQPIATGFAEWWVIGMHFINLAFAQQDDPDQFMEDLTAGKTTMAENPIFRQFKDILDLMIEFGDASPLTNDYNTQVATFANGQAAMMHQGNWTEATIYGIDPDLQVGVMPVPLNDDAEKMDRLAVGVPLNWVVNKQSKHPDVAKDFLNWMVNSPTGQEYLTKKFQFIPAFDHIEADGTGDIGKDVQKYSKEGKTIEWSFVKWPDGLNNKFSAILQGYVGKQYDYDSVLKQMDQAWQELN